MGIIEIGSDTTIPRLDFELTAGCDHRCSHCYNVWGADADDPQAGYDTRGQLDTPGLLALMSKAVHQSGATHITITGGEPLLRRDAMQILGHACNLARTVHLITNGSHVDAERAKEMADMGISSVQLTLLAGNREDHDRLKGAVCFDDTCRAAYHLTQAGVTVTVCFVAMRENADAFADVLRLCAALGIKHLSYNRMSPTGGAVHHIARLMPTVEDIEGHLHLANTLGHGLGIQIATAMPIPPCLVRIQRYPNVRFGYCSTGTESPNIVVDGKGNVRSCNLASGILGNLVEQDWAEIHANPYQQNFRRNVPEMCKGCAYETSCNGGCKESGFATFGDHAHPEPLVWLATQQGDRESLPLSQR